jgi:uncharacterized metal-binding protein YceD (DUF177 family)
MDALQEYYIPFVGLKLGKHTFTYHIDNTFFEVYQYNDFQSIECQVDLLFEKKPSLFELQFNIKGVVVINCDITNEPFEEKIENTLDLIVKFGEEYNDDNEEVLILPHSDYQINIAQYIYEAIVLALPIKRIHPGIKDGTLKSEVLDKLKELETNTTKKTDPRWDKLNELLTSKK